MEKKQVHENIQMRLLKQEIPLYQIALNNYDATQTIKNNRKIPVRQYIKNLSIHQEELRVSSYGDVDYMRKVVKQVQDEDKRHLDLTHRRTQLATAEFLFEGGGLMKSVQMTAEIIPSKRYFTLRLTVDDHGRPILFLTPTIQLMAHERQESRGHHNDMIFPTGKYYNSDSSDENIHSDTESSAGGRVTQHRRQINDDSSASDISENDISDENDAEERGMSRRDKKLMRQRLNYASKQDREYDKEAQE